MTTIAFDGKTLAVDSRVTQDNAQVGTADKSIITQHYIGAVCGDFVTIPVLRDWVKRGIPVNAKPKFKKGTEFILVLIERKSGEVLVFEDGLDGLLMDDKVFAYGSGAAYALGAMHNGATAKQAVQAAAAYDGNTGGKVRTIDFERKDER